MAEQNGSESLTKRLPHLAPDDDLLKVLDWGRQLEAKVDNYGESLNIWSQAILNQTKLAAEQSQLVVSQNLTLQETAKNNAALGLTLTGLRQGLSELQKEFNLLKNTISGPESTLKSLNDQNKSLNKKLDDFSLKLKSLETLESLNRTVEGLTIDLKTLSTDVNSTAVALNSKWNILTFAMVCVLVGQVALMFASINLSNKQTSAIQQVQKLTGWALTKLERLEKR